MQVTDAINIARDPATGETVVSLLDSDGNPSQQFRLSRTLWESAVLALDAQGPPELAPTPTVAPDADAAGERTAPPPPAASAEREPTPALVTPPAPGSDNVVEPGGEPATGPAPGAANSG